MIREIFTKNIGWKIIGLILALALWFHLATEKVYEKSFKAKIEVIGLSNKLTFDSIEPAETDVIFTGTGKQLLKLMISGGVRLEINLMKYTKPGEYVYYLSLSNLYEIDTSVFHRISFTNGDRYTIILKDKT